MKKTFYVFVLVCVGLCLRSFSDTIKENSSEKTKRADILIDSLSGGKYADCVKYFDKTMKSALPADKLESVWKSIISQAGSFKEKSSVRDEKSGAYTIIYVTCKFELAPLDAKIVFDKENNIAGLFFVPAKEVTTYRVPVYAKPDSFVETDVIIGSNEWKLPGTLALPNGNGPFPAVILIHGSGPQDRDESIGPNKPFKDIAIGLASRGIAVLRYEKRTKEYQQKMARSSKTITLKEEITDDVLSACELLRKTDKIDTRRIILLGHSMGGMLIPRLGILDKNTSGLIIMAGNTRSLEDLLIDQTRYIFSINNEIPQKEKDAQLAILLKQTDRIKRKDYDLNTAESELPLGVSPVYWQDLQKYNPTETAKDLKQPLLILQGDRDYQVTKLDFEGWQTNLKGKNNVEYKLYPKLNHLFMEGQGKSTPQEYSLENHVADYIINDIAGWINKQK